MMDNGKINKNYLEISIIKELSDLGIGYYDVDDASVYCIDERISKILYGISIGDIYVVYGDAVEDRDAMAAVEYLDGKIDFSNAQFKVYFGFPSDEQLQSDLKSKFPVCAILGHFDCRTDAPTHHLLHGKIHKYALNMSFFTVAMRITLGKNLDANAVSIMDTAATNMILKSDRKSDFCIHSYIVDKFVKLYKWNNSYSHTKCPVTNLNPLIDEIENFYLNGEFNLSEYKKYSKPKQHQFEYLDSVLMKLYVDRGIKAYITNADIDISQVFGYIKYNNIEMDILIKRYGKNSIILYTTSMAGFKYIKTILKNHPFMKNGLGFYMIGYSMPSIDDLYCNILKHGLEYQDDLYEAESEFYTREFEKLNME